MCDPQQTGHIMNEQGLEAPNRNTVYRYAKSVRGTDEAVKDMFHRHRGTWTRLARLTRSQSFGPRRRRRSLSFYRRTFRKDESLVVDRIRLPMLAIHASSYQFNQDSLHLSQSD
jgi:hypothetical protein